MTVGQLSLRDAKGALLFRCLGLFSLLLLMAVACAPAPPTESPQAPKVTEAPEVAPVVEVEAEEWERVVAQAKQEGRVTCGCPPVPAARELLVREFERAYPEITLEYTPGTLPEFPARVEAERAAGQYLWDIYFWGPGPEIYRLAHAGAFDPIRDALLLPEVRDPDVWGPWEQAFLDIQNRYVFAFWSELSNPTFNAEIIPPGDISALEDVFDPKYRGRIVWWDPRVGGGGSNAAAFIYHRFGEDGLRTVLVDQEALIVPGSVEVGEHMVRGTHPLGFGGDLHDVLRPYREAGMQVDIRPLGNTPEFAWEGVGYGTVTLFNQAPNPNAAKVFLNWLLSRETQATLSEELLRNSRRQDLPPVKPESLPLPGETYFTAQSEEVVLEIRGEAMELARSLRPS